MPKKLLIACYFFPPCPSIGGRRSAKFAKYLAKSGHEVHVIQAINPFPSVSPWLKDVDGEKNVHRHELPLHYPVEFIVPPKDIIEKLRYRAYSYFFRIFYAGRNRYDYTIFWERAYLKKAGELIRKHAIKNVLVSGPPFYYAHQTLKLKKEFPDLNIIIDFRDPWIGSPYYGMSSLKRKQQDHEIGLLNEVYEGSDYFIGPNQFLLNEQMSHVNKGLAKGAKAVEVPHAFDTEEVHSFLQGKESEPRETIRVVYGGQLYPGTDELLVSLSDMLSSVRKKNPDLYKRLRFDFYSPEQDKVKFFKEHSEVISFHKPVGNEIMSRIAEADICMIVLAGHNKNYRTTKFLEYSVLRKPFLVLGEKGYVAAFVDDNKLGRSFDIETLYDLANYLNDFKQYMASEYNRQFDFSEYEFGKVTGKLAELLK
jgi:hypothetical protein